MEKLRRKERDTSATVFKEGSLVRTTKLPPPLLREDDVARRRLLDWLLYSHRLVLIPTPAGYGKTTLVRVARRADQSTRTGGAVGVVGCG
jgi:ATP/maltotriose-dependent transcriptional regulator MalT